MKAPTLHSNGTSAADLLDGYAGMLRALRDAAHALRGYRPNARDYPYTGIDSDLSAFSVASQEHERRIRSVENIMGEIDSLAIAVDRQARERDARKSRTAT